MAHSGAPHPHQAVIDGLSPMVNSFYPHGRHHQLAAASPQPSTSTTTTAVNDVVPVRPVPSSAAVAAVPVSAPVSASTGSNVTSAGTNKTPQPVASTSNSSTMANA